jgi:hypothetical protein
LTQPDSLMLKPVPFPQAILLRSEPATGAISRHSVTTAHQRGRPGCLPSARCSGPPIEACRTRFCVAAGCYGAVPPGCPGHKLPDKACPVQRNIEAARAKALVARRLPHIAAPPSAAPCGAPSLLPSSQSSTCMPPCRISCGQPHPDRPLALRSGHAATDALAGTSALLRACMCLPPPLRSRACLHSTMPSAGKCHTDAGPSRRWPHERDYEKAPSVTICPSPHCPHVRSIIAVVYPYFFPFSHRRWQLPPSSRLPLVRVVEHP